MKRFLLILALMLPALAVKADGKAPKEHRRCCYCVTKTVTPPLGNYNACLYQLKNGVSKSFSWDYWLKGYNNWCAHRCGDLIPER